MKIDRDALVKAFLVDSEENLSTMEDALILLETHPEDEETLRAIFRGAHTLKGNASMLEFMELSELAHSIEDVLDRMRKQILHATPELISVILRAVDLMRQMAPTVSDKQRQLPPDLSRLMTDLARWSVHSEGAGPVLAPAPDRASAGSVTAATARAHTLRVEVDRLDQLLNLVGEIAIARGRLHDALDASPGCAQPLEIHHEADRLFFDLQDLIMKIRMVPLGPTCRQYSRTVRDTAATHGKSARLLVDGGDVEVDTTVIEHLRDPLTHIIRNAISHGIETPALRRERGKDPSGLVVIRARREASCIVVQVSDDGAGIDRRRLAEVAHSRGLLSDSDHVRDEDLLRLIFEPGFSTAAEVGDLSGRGVGMDIVRRSIEALRGTVEVESVPGSGTVVSMRIPLTLAIIPGFAVSVGEDTYVIPMDTVVECVELPADLHASGAGCVVLNLRGRPLPCLRLRHAFSVEATPPARENVVVVRNGEVNAGIIVDSLHGEIQAVVKPLGRLLGDVSGVAGSTILGSGRVALILDIPIILRQAIATVSPDRYPEVQAVLAQTVEEGK